MMEKRRETMCDDMRHMMFMGDVQRWRPATTCREPDGGFPEHSSVKVQEFHVLRMASCRGTTHVFRMIQETVIQNK